MATCSYCTNTRGLPMTDHIAKEHDLANSDQLLTPHFSLLPGFSLTTGRTCCATVETQGSSTSTSAASTPCLLERQFGKGKHLAFRIVSSTADHTTSPSGEQLAFCKRGGIRPLYTRTILTSAMPLFCSSMHSNNGQAGRMISSQPREAEPSTDQR